MSITLFPRALALALLAAIAASGCSRPTPEQLAMTEAITALGGERIQNIRTLVLEGSGVQHNLGQDVTPEASSQTFRVSDYRRTIDWTNGAPRIRVEQTRTADFDYYLGPAPQSVVFGLDGPVAYDVRADGTATRASEGTADDRRVEVYHHPITALRAALAGGRLANVRTEGSDQLVDLTTSDGVALTIALDPQTHVPTRITSRIDQPNLGDVTLETRFADYQIVGGLKLPTRLTTTIDDFVTADLQIATQRVDAEIGDIAAPAAAASAEPPAPRSPVVAVEDVAPGVWLLAGQSHHSAVVELSDRLVLIEAPQSEARTLAVIAKARELNPDKPLTTLINTHHHFDHSAGVRAAVSEGLSVITHAGNRAFIEEIVKRPHTIAPDVLARKPAPLELDVVDDTMTLGDADMSLVLYPVDGNPHSETLLMAYVPKYRLLIQADGFSPGFETQPYAPNLIENVRRRKLRVDRVVPLHGDITTFAELEKWDRTSGTP